MSGGDWAGFVVDVGVTLAIGKFIPGGSGGKALLRSLGMEAGAGFAGGAAGQYAKHIWDTGGDMSIPFGDMLKGGFQGAGGALIGSAAARGLSRIAKTSGKLVTTADDAAKLAGTRAQAWQHADDALTTAGKNLDDATKVADDLRDELIRKGWWKNGAPNRPTVKGKKEFDALKKQYDDAVTDVGAKTKLRDDALLARDNAVDNWQTQQIKADELSKKMKSSVRYKVGDTFDPKGWGRAGMLAAGSGLFSLIEMGGDDGGGGGDNRQKGEEVEQQAQELADIGKIVYVGGPALEELPTKQQTGPFVMHSNTAAATAAIKGPTQLDLKGGYLVMPTALANEQLRMWYGGNSSSTTNDCLADYLTTTRKLFGDEKNPPKSADLAKYKCPTINPTSGTTTVADQSGTMLSYSDVARNLITQAQHFDELQLNVTKIEGDAAKNTISGQKNLDNLVVGINTYVGDQTKYAGTNNKGIEAAFVNLLSKAFEEAAGVKDSTTGADTDLAAAVKAAEAKARQEAEQAAAAQIKSLQDANAAMQAQQQNPGWQAQQTNPNQYDPNPANTNPNGNGTTPDTVPQQLQDAIRGIENSAANPNLASPGTTAPVGMDPSMMNPFGMNGMGMNPYGMGMNPYGMDPSQMEEEDEERRKELDPRRLEDKQPTAPTPWQQQQQQGQQPGAQPVAADAAHPQGAQPASNTSAPGNGLPPRIPGSDGLVEYVYPDGRKQKVAPAVATALDIAFTKADGSSAQEAYAKTGAKWTDNKRIGNRVDPYQLKTGDVAMWDGVSAAAGSAPDGADPTKDSAMQPAASFRARAVSSSQSDASTTERTVLVVAFPDGGEGAAGTLEVIVDGKLQQFAPEMKDAKGDFGGFAGFFHPQGVDTAKGADVNGTPTSDPTQPGNGDQSSGMLLQPAAT